MVHVLGFTLLSGAAMSVQCCKSITILTSHQTLLVRKLRSQLPVVSLTFFTGELRMFGRIFGSTTNTMHNTATIQAQLKKLIISKRVTL